MGAVNAAIVGCLPSHGQRFPRRGQGAASNPAAVWFLPSCNPQNLVVNLWIIIVFPILHFWDIKIGWSIISFHHFPRFSPSDSQDMPEKLNIPLAWRRMQPLLPQESQQLQDLAPGQRDPPRKQQGYLQKNWIRDDKSMLTEITWTSGNKELAIGIKNRTPRNVDSDTWCNFKPLQSTTFFCGSSGTSTLTG